jgi:ABC-type transport system involved in multi-copper enzyme maturation permease subunit
VRSEFTKFRTVRSTYATLATAFVAVAVLGPVVCALFVSKYPDIEAEEKASFSAAHLSLTGILLAQLAIGALGVLLITSEYTTGLIRATFAAVPQRRTVLAAKAIVFTVVVLLVSEIACFIAFFAGQAFLAQKGLETHIGDPGVLRAVIGGGLYLSVLGLLALGLGTLIRHSAGAIAALFGLLLVLPGIAGALPQAWQNTINQYLPGNAGQQIFALRIEPHTLQPWAGFGVFCIYAAIALVGAAVLLERRDA